MDIQKRSFRAVQVLQRFWMTKLEVTLCTQIYLEKDSTTES
jgi:hypothetical protein